MKIKTPRDHAIAFIAAYDVKDSGSYEKHVVKIARTWLSIMKARHSVQRIVDGIMDEFAQPTPDDYGAGWDDLKIQFTTWAVANEWWGG